jgi:hypothetical protein
MSFTNFAALQSLTGVGSTDQFLVSLNNSLSGAAGFGRVTTAAMAQLLSFNSSNAQLSISNGNTISLSALSASGGSGTDTGVRALTANWQSTYTTVSSNSATWGSGSSTSGLTIFRQVSSIVSPNNVTTVHALSVNSLSANVDFAIVAKGTGATLAQIPDNAVAGGNKRGTRATDWQKERSFSSQVASGANSTIGGGGSNTASGSHATIAGGQGNITSNQHATVGGGQGNNVGGPYAAIAGGINNIASNTGSTIGGGGSNNVNGVYATIAGGTSNFTGGTYATVGGGISNTASSSFAAIGGGGSNAATGGGATVGGGTSNNASGNYTTVPGGYGARAHNYGQYAYSSHYFADPGDGQHFQYVLYGTSINGDTVVLSPDCANYTIGDSSIPSLFVYNQNMIAILTVQVIGFDDSQNYSHSLTKLVVRKVAGNSFNEELLVNTTLGTDGTAAGVAAFAINTNASPVHVFTVTGSSNAGDNTRWVAHVSGTWVYIPPSY